MVTTIVVIGMILICVGGVYAVYSGEINDWMQEQIEKSPHQIKRKWKTKYFSDIQYHWECTCGRSNWSTSKTIAYTYFIEHRRKERKEAKMQKTVEETEGW